MRIEDVVVGETYRIRQWEDMEKEFGIKASGNIGSQIPFVINMKHLCGERCKVTSKSKNEVGIKFDNTKYENTWAFSADMLETIEENKMPIEIKPGYIVVFLDKKTRVADRTVALEKANGEVYCADEYGWYDLKKDFSDGMENESFKIIKVYGLPKREGTLFSVDGRELLYDASVKKMTKSEIEKELGYKIEIVEE